ncbi:hypothetical protein ACFU5O_29685 [Streptomyces sp. NPDC057445]|uniref:hypothetical protein n=1 Tax=Streptomyces sp. NPDC057445 TaxID=3346136 RepID=UPI0036B42B33
MSATALVRLKRIALTALCSATALGLTGCGTLGPDGKETREAGSGPFADLSGPEVVNKSFRATKEAKSLTLDIDMKSPDGPVKAYLAVNTKGDCAGTVSIDSAGTTELIKTGNSVYMRFDETMLRMQSKGDSKEETDAVLKALLGKWVETEADSEDARDMVEFCDLDTYLAGFEDNDNIAKKAGESKVNGASALMLTERDGEEKYTAHVAVEGTPYLLKLQVTGGKEPGSMTFSGFNKPVPATKPARKDIADVG